MNILIVDDSLIMRRVIKGAVENHFDDVTVLEAEDGLVAIERVKEHKVDIMFLDWNMPKMNGEEVLESIRANPEYKSIRVIMATTEGTKDKVLRVMKKGVSGYLVKPFQEEGIRKMLDTVTARMKR